MITLLCKHRWTYEETIIRRREKWGEQWEDYRVVQTCQWCGKQKITTVGSRKIEAENERPNK